MTEVWGKWDEVLTLCEAMKTGSCRPFDRQRLRKNLLLL